jgi:hypothetical protein
VKNQQMRGLREPIRRQHPDELIVQLVGILGSSQPQSL